MEKRLRKSVPHVLAKIFFSIDYGSYMECHKVNKEWHELLASNRYCREAEKMLNQKRRNREIFDKLVFDDNDEEIKYFLSSGVDANFDVIYDELTPIFYTPLVWSVRKGHIDMVKVLLDGGTDLNKAAKYGRTTPLLEAVTEGRKDVVQLLLDRGADPNKANKVGSTPLHFSALWVNRDVVQLLLDRGADPNKADEVGSTPLHSVAVYGWKDMVQLLLEGGADPNKANKNGLTPLQVAANNGQTGLVQLLK